MTRAYLGHICHVPRVYLGFISQGVTTLFQFGVDNVLCHVADPASRRRRRRLLRRRRCVVSFSLGECARTVTRRCSSATSTVNPPNAG